ncbi:MAG TPA: transglycosylase family protein [Solirubrobacteraceae bacterium]
MITPPGDLRAGAMALLTNRHVHFARRYHQLLGDPLTRSERQALRRQVATLTPFKLRVETRELRGDIRHLRRKLQRQLAGGAPDVAIPPQLSAIAQCESGGNPRAISSSGTYRGKYQFSFTTWATVGGKGDPAAAPETEQDRRAAILYHQEGPGQWPVCGR